MSHCFRDDCFPRLTSHLREQAVVVGSMACQHAPPRRDGPVRIGEEPIGLAKELPDADVFEKLFIIATSLQCTTARPGASPAVTIHSADELLLDGTAPEEPAQTSVHVGWGTHCLVGQLENALDDHLGWNCDSRHQQASEQPMERNVRVWEGVALISVQRMIRDIYKLHSEVSAVPVAPRGGGCGVLQMRGAAIGRESAAVRSRGRGARPPLATSKTAAMPIVVEEGLLARPSKPLQCAKMSGPQSMIWYTSPQHWKLLF